MGIKPSSFTYGGSSGQWPPNTISISGSNDETNWTGLVSMNTTNAGSSGITVSVTTSTFYKYFRFDCSGGYGGSRAVGGLTINGITKSSSLNSITMSCSHYSSTSYSPYLGLYGGSGTCYISSRSKSSLELSNSSSATNIYYGTIGY